MNEEDKTSPPRTARRWRTAGGFLLSVLILFFITFSSRRPAPSLMERFPWLRYVFLTVLIMASFVFLVIWKKEHAPSENRNAEITPTEIQRPIRTGLILRIAAGVLGIVLFTIVLNYILFSGFRGAMLIIFFGGYSLLFFRVTVTGRWR